MKIAVIGLGYIGLPLSLLFAHKGVRVLGMGIDLSKNCQRFKTPSVRPGLQFQCGQDAGITGIPSARSARSPVCNRGLPRPAHSRHWSDPRTQPWIIGSLDAAIVCTVHKLVNYRELAQRSRLIVDAAAR